MTTLPERLERGEILSFAPCPFMSPTGDDLTFLMNQQLKSSAHKNISYNPETNAVSGFSQQSTQQSERLQALLRNFRSSACTGWRSACRVTPRPGCLTAPV